MGKMLPPWDIANSCTELEVGALPAFWNFELLLLFWIVGTYFGEATLALKSQGREQRNKNRPAPAGLRVEKPSGISQAHPAHSPFQGVALTILFSS